MTPAKAILLYLPMRLRINTSLIICHSRVLQWSCLSDLRPESCLSRREKKNRFCARNDRNWHWEERQLASGRGEADCAAGEYVYTLKDVEIAGLIAAHLAWGRRDMIVRDCNRAFEEMQWRPLEYVMRGEYRCGQESLHRTIRWSEFAAICGRMRVFYAAKESVESLTPDQIRVQIYGQASNPKMANKKIHMFRRWMVRNDGIVDLGLWSHTSPADLIIPLDTHVHASALKLGITTRKSADITTALEITEFLKEAFPDDPCKGDFALFAYAAENKH